MSAFLIPAAVAVGSMFAFIAAGKQLRYRPEHMTDADWEQAEEMRRARDAWVDNSWDMGFQAGMRAGLQSTPVLTPAQQKGMKDPPRREFRRDYPTRSKCNCGCGSEGLRCSVK
jgi:hypothetical protein